MFVIMDFQLPESELVSVWRYLASAASGGWGGAGVRCTGREVRCWGDVGVECGCGFWVYLFVFVFWIKAVIGQDGKKQRNQIIL